MAPGHWPREMWCRKDVGFAFSEKFSFSFVHECVCVDLITYKSRQALKTHLRNPKKSFESPALDSLRKRILESTALNMGNSKNGLTIDEEETISDEEAPGRYEGRVSHWNIIFARTTRSPWWLNWESSFITFSIVDFTKIQSTCSSQIWFNKLEVTLEKAWHTTRSPWWLNSVVDFTTFSS